MNKDKLKKIAQLDKILLDLKEKGIQDIILNAQSSECMTELLEFNLIYTGKKEERLEINGATQKYPIGNIYGINIWIDPYIKWADNFIIYNNDQKIDINEIVTDLI